MNKKMNEGTWRYRCYGITTTLVLLSIILLYVIFGPLSSATFENCDRYKCMIVINGSSCRLEYKDYICDCELSNYSKYEYAKYEIDCYVGKDSEESCPTDNWKVCRNDAAFVWFMICTVLAALFTAAAVISICQSCMLMRYSKNNLTDNGSPVAVELESPEAFELEYPDAVELEYSDADITR